MLKISRLLCVIDPTTDHQPALQRAASVARATGAELELMICYYNQYVSGDLSLDAPALKRVRAEQTRRHRRMLELMANPLRGSGIVVETTVVWDQPLYAGAVIGVE